MGNRRNVEMSNADWALTTEFFPDHLIQMKKNDGTRIGGHSFEKFIIVELRGLSFGNRTFSGSFDLGAVNGNPRHGRSRK